MPPLEGHVRRRARVSLTGGAALACASRRGSRSLGCCATHIRGSPRGSNWRTGAAVVGNIVELPPRALGRPGKFAAHAPVRSRINVVVAGQHGERMPVALRKTSQCVLYPSAGNREVPRVHVNIHESLYPLSGDAGFGQRVVLDHVDVADAIVRRLWHGVPRDHHLARVDTVADGDIARRRRAALRRQPAQICRHLVTRQSERPRRLPVPKIADTLQPPNAIRKISKRGHVGKVQVLAQGVSASSRSSRPPPPSSRPPSTPAPPCRGTWPRARWPSSPWTGA